MEEADLLRERLQAITEKRRIQEDIAKKRREIEEVKLKLQYLKKKALREQWLMDGVSGQNAQEEEAMKAQAQAAQHETELLQSHLHRIESEIESLETEEMNISANEKLTLKRLKEVEKTAEDIIKEVNGVVQPEPVKYIYSTIPDIPKSYTPTLVRRINTPVQKPDGEAEKRAMYAVEISVEKNLRTGKRKVLSSTTVTPEEFQEKGTKVYDDGRKSVYAVQPAGNVSEDDKDELSPLELEELLKKATEKKYPTDVEYHEPVFSSPYSRSCAASKAERGIVSPAPNGYHSPSKTPSPTQPDNIRKHFAHGQTDSMLSPSHIPDPKAKQYFDLYQSTQSAINGEKENNTKGYGGMNANQPQLIQELEELQAFTPVPDSGFERNSPLHPIEDSTFHIVNSIPSELECSEPVTMIFMGYQNAESDEENDAIEAELVVIGDDEDEDEEEPTLSYHPLGYRSKIFQPRNDNIYRSEVSPRVFSSHSSEGSITEYKAEDPTEPVWKTKVPQGAATGYPEHLELDGTEVNEACISPPNHTETELKSPSSPVTMEISEQVGTENIIDFQMEVQDQEVPENNGVSAKDEQAHYEDDLLEFPTAEVMVDILTELPSDDTHDDELENAPCPKEALVLEDPHDEFNRNESITSSVSDTPSSAESVYENEALRKRQDSVKEESSKNTVSIIKFSEDRDIREPLKTESHEDILEALACDEVEESMLEAYIREEVMSDISAGSVHDPDDLEECLRVEIAAASSDSETDEKWRTIFSSSINKEDDDSYLDSLQLSAQELFIQKPEANNEENHSDEKEEEQQDIPAEEDVLEQPEIDSTYPQPTQEISYNPTPLFHGLSKISEDEEELGKSAVKDTSGSCVKSDPNKKVPKDYCVIQEMKSENVSTEHVDFRVARNQWLQMEEQTKNLMYQPATKTGTCQGSHSFMYTPVRNIDRPKRDHDLENLALGREYSNTQFSPCSEDSGLGDSSYRSPYDDPETPVEKEIRSAMDREERLRRERGMSKSYSSDCVQGKGRPIILNPGSLCQEVDEKRKMLEHHEDYYRLSSSNNMPSFIITSSPTRGSQKHDYAANNVIILEPEPCHQSPHHSAKLVTSKSADWKSEDNPSVIILETSNLIIRSASEFNLNSSVETPEKTFLNNPFFKLRSRSTLSLLDEEIKMVKQREEELKRQRAKIYSKDNFLASPSLLDSSYDKQDDFPVKCKSSPSSPMKTYKMDRSTLSCDHRFPESYSGGRRKSAMALRWEAGEFANN